MTAAYQAFVENDFALFEINPLSVRENGDILCVDAKVGIDSNALYRLPEVAALRDKSQENERELKASEFDLNYVALGVILVVWSMVPVLRWQPWTLSSFMVVNQLTSWM